MTAPVIEERPRFEAGDLRRFTAAVFAGYGMPPGDADEAAEVLIDADLAGIESHGIAHLPWHPGYAPGFKRGTIAPVPQVTVLRDSPARDSTLVVPYLDIDALVDGLVALAERPSRRRQLVDQARDVAARHHDVSVGAPGLLAEIVARA